MMVLVPSKELASELRKAGEKMTAEWIGKAGAKGEAVIEKFQKVEKASR